MAKVQRLAAGFLVGLAAWPGGAPAAQGEEPAWLEDLAEARKRAGETGRPLLVYVYDSV